MPRHLPHGDEALSRPDEQPVWDLPVRLFHWTLAALILFSWWSVENHRDDWHLWSGFAILALLLFRLLWGVVGSSTARFSSFIRGPAAVRRYLKGEWRGIGHTPLGALNVVALLGATAVQVALGLISEDDDGLMSGPLSRLVSVDTSDAARDLHETWFYVLFGLIALHIAAVLLYRLRGKTLVKAMITGRAQLPVGTQPMQAGKWWLALLCLLAALALTRWIVAGAPPFG